MFKYSISRLKKIVISALMIASFIVLDRFLTINTQFLAINLSIVAVMVTALLLGPKYSVIVAALGDLIGAIVFPFGSYFVGFTISSAITGLIFGLFIYQKPNKENKLFILKAVISNILVLLLVNIFLNSCFLHIMYGKALMYYLGLRISTQLVLCPIYIAIIIALKPILMKFVEKHIYTEERIIIDEYLKNFVKFTKTPSLDAMYYLMKKFDNPHKKLKYLHIAGTNGKGSTAEMLSNVLVEAGYKVGKFISPHLISFNDGILINNKEISDREVEEIMDDLAREIKEYNNTHKVRVTWFEAITSLALIYFYKNNCDFVVLETGLGGKYDCTNVVDSMISIITNIGYDHVDVLGNTIEKIAMQKAGIIKPKTDTVAIYQEDTIKIIEDTCKEKNTKLHIVNPKDVKEYSFSKNAQTFTYKEFKNIEINLKGKVQIYNASEALECINILREEGFNISEDAIRKGLKTVIHKARMETISKEPLIVFDGGHNEDAIKNLKENIKDYFGDLKDRLYIVSILNTKDYKTVIKELTEDKESQFVFTTGNSKTRYIPAKKLYDEAKKYVPEDNLKTMDLKDAIKLAKNSNKELILFVGSFYVYKDVREAIHD